MTTTERLHKWPNGNMLFKNSQGFMVMEVDAMGKPSSLRFATRHEIATWKKAERKRPYKQRRFM